MSLVIAISTVKDGNMAFHDDESIDDVSKNRSIFLTKNNIDIHQTTRVGVTYNTADFCKYYEITDIKQCAGMFDKDAVVCDAIITKIPNCALFLPIADCIGAVIFDPSKNILMLSHLGRHSVEQNGGYKSIKFLVDNYGCKSEELQIYLGPSAGHENYPIYSHDNCALKDLVFEQLHLAGVKDDNITNNQIDTTKDLNYFSHSEFLKGHRPTDDDYAIVAIMKN